MSGAERTYAVTSPTGAWPVARVALIAFLAVVLVLLSAQPAFAAKPPPADPVVASLSHYYAPPGTQVTIYGTGFGTQKQNSYVVLDGVRMNQFRDWTDTSVVFIVPDGWLAGYAGIVADGQPSNGIFFVGATAPVVSSISTAMAPPGTEVVITGQDFVDVQGEGWVSFAGTPGEVVSWSDTEVVARVPAGASAGYLGVVQHGLSSNGLFFEPWGVPVVDAISADYAIVGDAITITGSDFGTTGEVVIGGVPVPHDTWSDTEVVFTVQDYAQGYVGVLCNGLTSNGIYSTHAPRVDELSSWWAAPGSTLTMTGVGFGDGSDGGWATLNGASIPVVSWSDTAVTVTVPEDAEGGLIGVVRGYWATSNGRDVVVTSQAHIDALSATEVVPGQQVTITGTDFGVADAASEVLVGGTLACSIVSWSDTEIVFTVPAELDGGYVGVYKQGVPSNGVWVQRSLVAPVVSGSSAWWGTPGTEVTIFGSGFGAIQGSGYPVFAGTAAQVVSWSDTAITAIVPVGAATGYAGIAQNGTVSNGVFFMPFSPPHIDSASPGVVAPGETVTVTGSGFRDAPGLLTLAGIPVTALTWSDTEIVFDVPTDAVAGYIGVTHDGIQSNGFWLEVVR